MDDFSTWLNNKKKQEQEVRQTQIDRLQTARENLIPIIDNVVQSELNKNCSKSAEKYTLSPKECRYVKIAKQTLEEIDSLSKFQTNKIYELPNANPIINTANTDCKGKVNCDHEKPMIIDEVTVVQLLELYENVGVAIQRLVNESIKINDLPTCSNSGNLNNSDGSKICHPCNTGTERPKSILTNVQDPDCVCQEFEDDGNRKETPHAVESSENDKQILIRIQYANEDGEVKSTTSSTKNVSFGQDPVTLKLNEDADGDGATYCIRMGDIDDRTIRIVIKQNPDSEDCEEVDSETPNSSEEDYDYEPLEVITEDCECDSKVMQCKSKQIRIKLPICRSDNKMDVIIDSENVGRSKVKVRNDRENWWGRKRVCSSMEFDVGTTDTRLRQTGIEHPNPKIAAELEKLGVDTILRASRPAKCCRKAIINERQRVAMPYCVSLQSLPLIDKDIDIVKQSLEMSLRKNKKSPQLTNSQKNTLSYYVSLGEHDFTPSINFPWVASLYNLKLNQPFIQEDEFYRLKSEINTCSGENEPIPEEKLRKSEPNVFKYNAHKMKTRDDEKRGNVRSDLRRLNTTSTHQYPQKRKSIWSNSKEFVFLEENPCDFNDKEFAFKVQGNGDSNFSGKPNDSYEKNNVVMDRKFLSTASGNCLRSPQNILYNHKKVRMSELTNVPERKLQLKLRKSVSLPVLTRPFRLSSHSSKNPIGLKRNLEYYIDLVNGNLVWSASIPLKPIHYVTYYNFAEILNVKKGPVEEQMNAIHVTHEEAQRGVPTNLDPNTYHSTPQRLSFGRRSTVSDLDAIDTTQNVGAVQATKPVPKAFEGFSMGPESETEPWAPLIASVTSIPQIQDQALGKTKQEGVYAEQPKPREGKKCSEKSVCFEKDCLDDCSPGKCEKPPPECRDKIRVCVKRSNKGISATGTAPAPCTKDICEIYKNDRVGGSKGPPKEKERKEQVFKASAKENIEIFINNRKICFQKKPKK